jgi:hypothetical protein
MRVEGDSLKFRECISCTYRRSFMRLISCHALEFVTFKNED